MVKTLRLKSEHYQQMRQHVVEQAPLEACGLLAGKKDSVEAVLKVRNVDQSPVRFRMDPQEQYKALMWIEAENLDLVGIYHSHPTGPETVSATDIDEHAYDVVHIIWSCQTGTWKARAFWIETGQVTTVELQVIKEE